MYRVPAQDLNQFKVPLIGDSSVGKTSIVNRYTSVAFSGNASPTVGVSIVTISFTINNEKIELSIWDTAGQEKFRSLVPLYTRHAALVILVFDISSRTSFDGLDGWIEKIRSEMGIACPIFVVANKIDLANLVPQDEITRWADQNECTAYFTSAITGDGVGDMFRAVAEKLMGCPSPSGCPKGQQMQGITEKKPAAQSECC
jgi:small GTP-binding protein